MKRFISEQTDNEKLLNVIDRIRKGEDVKLKVVKKGNSDIYELVEEITPENNYIPILTLNYSGNDENKKKNHPIILVLLIAILKKR